MGKLGSFSLHILIFIGIEEIGLDDHRFRVQSFTRSVWAWMAFPEYMLLRLTWFFVTFHTKIWTSLKRPMHVCFALSFTSVELCTPYWNAVFYFLFFFGRKMIKLDQLWMCKRDQPLKLSTGIFQRCWAAHQCSINILRQKRPVLQ